MGILATDVDSSFNIINMERLNSLKDIEVLVFEKILRHHSIRDIAWELSLTPGTIRMHRARIYSKFKIYPRTHHQIRWVWAKSIGDQKNIPRW